MSSCLLPLYGATCLTKSPISLKKRKFRALQARPPSFRNEGRSGNNIVDANMSVLREKIEEVKLKEREKCRGCEIGWNNNQNYKIIKRWEGAEGLWHELVELVGIMVGTIGITIVSGTAFLCLFSLLVHFNS